MVRRNIAITVLALAALAAGACSNPTAPKCDQVSIGTNNEQVSIGTNNDQVSIGTNNDQISIGTNNLSCSR